MKNFKKGFTVVILTTLMTLDATAQTISGNVFDAKTKEPLIGATIEVVGAKMKTLADVNGDFKLDGLPDGKYNLVVRYVSYKERKISGVQVMASEAGAEDSINIALQPDEHMLQGISVTATIRKNTEKAMIKAARNSAVIVNNVSAQEISKTQDTNAGEVIRRVPGISIIEDKFVMVRGLSQRYNNVWVNGGAVPSTEADSRAFSFDIIPSSQLDNLEIIKAPAPEYPADYSGGFILVNTKDIPAENSMVVSVGGNWNDATHFKNFSYSKGSDTDFLGFDGGLRSLRGGINSVLSVYSNGGVDLKDNGLNNDWMIRQRKAIGDLKLSASVNHRWKIGGRTLGMITSLNYTNESRTYDKMENNLYGIYDAQNDRSNYLRHSVDDQYNQNVRVGAMMNFTLLSRKGNSKYQLKNIFNQLGNNRYTWRHGVSAQANLENSAEYYYRSRTTYNGQLSGKHDLSDDLVEWNIGYAYANRHMPDRRRYLLDDALESGVMALSTGNDISREWTQLDEHVFSININDKHQFSFGSWKPFLRYGVHGEYRTRKYTTRDFIYNWNANDNNMPPDFRTSDITTLLSNSNNFGIDKLYLLEDVNMRNDYSGHNTLGAGYFAVSLPFGKFGVYTGIRFEYNRMELISNTKDTEISHSSRYYTSRDFFPSVNAVYKLDGKSQLRASYGRSLNRPEFREVSSSVFYDFDLASSVQGNTELENCYVDNIDLRYEFYPSDGEQITLAAFYKHFNSPIEWTYTVSGGTDYIYSYKNAQSANNYGLELDIRKNLSFIGLPDFGWSFNGSLIKSKVKFEEGAREKNRPMQGQSPYLINTGVFYNNRRWNMDIAFFYNRIGKRLIGVGRSEGTTGSDENARIPDSYEMPRNVMDLTLSKKIGSHWEMKMNIRDFLAEKVSYKQFADVIYKDGSSKTVEQIVRQYKPGRNIGLAVLYKF